MTAPDDLAFTGHWVQRGAIKVPVLPPDDYIFDFTTPHVVYTSAPIDHVPSHAGFNAHRRRGEEPCHECRAAERMYHHNRRKRG